MTTYTLTLDFNDVSRILDCLSRLRQIEEGEPNVHIPFRWPARAYEALMAAAKAHEAKVKAEVKA